MGFDVPSNDLIFFHLDRQNANGAMLLQLFFSICLGAAFLDFVSHLSFDYELVRKPGWSHPAKAISRSSYMCFRILCPAVLLQVLVWLIIPTGHCYVYALSFNILTIFVFNACSLVFVERTMVLYEWRRKVVLPLAAGWMTVVVLSILCLPWYGIGRNVPGTDFCYYDTQRTKRLPWNIAFKASGLILDTTVLVLTVNRLVDGGIKALFRPRKPTVIGASGLASGLMKNGAGYYLMVVITDVAFQIMYWGSPANSIGLQTCGTALLITIPSITAGSVYRSTRKFSRGGNLLISVSEGYGPNNMIGGGSGSASAGRGQDEMATIGSGGASESSRRRRREVVELGAIDEADFDDDDDDDIYTTKKRSTAGPSSSRRNARGANGGSTSALESFLPVSSSTTSTNLLPVASSSSFFEKSLGSLTKSGRGHGGGASSQQRPSMPLASGSEGVRMEVRSHVVVDQVSENDATSMMLRSPSAETFWPRLAGRSRPGSPNVSIPPTTPKLTQGQQHQQHDEKSSSTSTTAPHHFRQLSLGLGGGSDGGDSLRAPEQALLSPSPPSFFASLPSGVTDSWQPRTPSSPYPGSPPAQQSHTTLLHQQQQQQQSQQPPMPSPFAHSQHLSVAGGGTSAIMGPSNASSPTASLSRAPGVLGLGSSAEPSSSGWSDMMHGERAEASSDGHGRAL